MNYTLEATIFYNAMESDKIYSRIHCDDNLEVDDLEFDGL